MPVHVLHLTCPHCFATLRLQDQSFVRKRAACPACGDAIHLSPDTTHGVIAEVPSSDGAPLVYGVLTVVAPAAPASEAGGAIADAHLAGDSGDRNPAAAAAVPAQSKTRRRNASKDSKLAKRASSDLAKSSSAQRAPMGRSVTAERPGLAPTAIPGTVAAGLWQRLSTRLQSPRVIGWSVGAAALLALLAFAGWNGRDESTDSAGQIVNASTASEQSTDKRTLPSVAIQPERSAEASAVSLDPNPPDDRSKTPVAAEETPSSIAVAELPPLQVQIPIAEAELPDTAVERPAAANPKKPVIDIASRLRQPIVRFEQSRAVPLKELLLVVEEMVGVPVGFDPDSPDAKADSLERTVSLRLQNTTVGGLLQSLAEKGGLSYEIQDDAIRLKLR